MKSYPTSGGFSICRSINFHPTRVLEYQGVLLNTYLGSVFLPQCKFLEIQRITKAVMARDSLMAIKCSFCVCYHLQSQWSHNPQVVTKVNSVHLPLPARSSFTQRTVLPQVIAQSSQVVDQLKQSFLGKILYNLCPHRLGLQIPVGMGWGWGAHCVGQFDWNVTRKYS